MTSIAPVTNTSFTMRVPRQNIGYAGLGSMLLRWYDRARQRRQLADMDARMLDDIGVSRHQAIAEARKPGWVG